MTAGVAAPSAAVDLSGFASVQPHPNLPTLGVDRYHGVECFDIGEDGDMLILGHVGTLRAIEVFRARLRGLTSRGEADHIMHDLETAKESTQHLWAVRITRCQTYPMCRSLGPTGQDGKPCHDDDGTGHDDHDWSDWSDRTDQLTKPTEEGLWMRWCDRCNLYETRPARPRTNRCTQCRQIDDCGDFYLRCDAAPDTPGAFPVTYWTA